MTELLDVRHLRVAFPGDGDDPMVAVDDVSFHVAPGELVALVGESGCGKTLTGLALLGLLPPDATLGPDSVVRFDGTDLARLPATALRRYRGARLGMIFQDPMSSLNPVLRVGDQVIEALTTHRAMPRRAARHRAIELLGEVGIADPTRRIDAWPHQLSGGMRQRVMIAMALAGEPELLVADEPTTALDVTVQAQILELLDTIRRARGMAVLLITHDLAIVAGRADRVMVMYAGRIVEEAATRELFLSPRHPYTQGLLAALPRIDAGGDPPRPIPGSVPSPSRWPAGCRFHPRCPMAIDRCGLEAPPLEPAPPGHRVACWVAQRTSAS